MTPQNPSPVRVSTVPPPPLGGSAAWMIVEGLYMKLVPMASFWPGPSGGCTGSGGIRGGADCGGMGGGSVGGARGSCGRPGPGGGGGGRVGSGGILGGGLGIPITEPGWKGGGLGGADGGDGCMGGLSSVVHTTSTSSIPICMLSGKWPASAGKLAGVKYASPPLMYWPE